MVLKFVNRVNFHNPASGPPEGKTQYIFLTLKREKLSLRLKSGRFKKNNKELFRSSGIFLNVQEGIFLILFALLALSSLDLKNF